MKRNKIALALSFVYCGFGQICIGKVAKGISLAAIYTLLILSLYASQSLPVTRFLIGTTILAMWIMGIVDSYIGTDFYRREFRKRIILTAISSSIVLGAIVLMLMSWPRIFALPDSQSIQDERPSVARLSAEDKATQPGESDKLKTSDIADSDHEIPQLMASNNTDKVVSIHSCSLEADIVRPGSILTISYEISASKSMVVGLAFSIKDRNSPGWISDLDNDLIPHAIGGGRGRYSRKFTVPLDIEVGKYGVAWGIWDPGFDIAYDSKLSKDALTIIASDFREMFTDSAQYSANVR